MRITPLLFLFLFVIGCADVQKVEPQQLYGFTYQPDNPFKSPKVFVVIVLDVKQDKNGVWWVHYSHVYDEEYSTNPDHTSAKKQDYFLRSYDLMEKK